MYDPIFIVSKQQDDELEEDNDMMIMITSWVVVVGL
jgi:hypothetical protein